jgi:hydroxymethylglutaryl-CoA reductase (NADPH)
MTPKHTPNRDAPPVLHSGEDPAEHRVPGRGRYDEAARRDRLDWISARTDTPLDALSEIRLVPERLTGNIENMIGAVEIPVGLAGPLRVHGSEWSDIVYAPFATTEGALVASASRGATAVTRAGGVRAQVLRQRMTRAPAFELASRRDAEHFASWLGDQLETLRQKCHAVSRHASLRDVAIVVDGAVVHALFSYTTGEAAGQNMTTAATWHCCQWIIAQVPALGMSLTRFVIDGNMSADKKVTVAADDWARGTAVIAECTLDADSVMQGLKVQPSELLATHEICQSGARHARIVAPNVNVANAVAAIFTATGQDIASIHESAVGVLELFPAGSGVRARLFMPGVVVGTVGGGTHLPAQHALLAMMGCRGDGSSRRLAEIIAGFCLALDLSTLAAIATGEFATAHERLGRNRPVHAFGDADLDAEFFARALRRSLAVPDLHVDRVERLDAPSGSSILTDLAARRLGKSVGLHHRRVHHVQGHTDVVVKVKPLDAEVALMMQSLAAACGERVARAHARFRSDTGFAGCHLRELAVYAQTDPRFLAHVPRVYDIHRDDSREAYVLVLERLSDLRLMDSAGDPSGWTATDIEAAIRGAGAFHAIWMGRARALEREPWIGLSPSAERMVAMRPLWDALAEHTASEFPALMSDDDLGRHKLLTDTLGDWWGRLESMPRTLIHNDFNPRNVGIRGSGADARLCAYDWELATLHVPQHDVAELLAFVLSPAVDEREVEHYVELHRRLVAEAGAAVPDAREWRAGFALAARDLLINRFGLYLMGYTVHQWDFIARTLATLRALIGLELERR